MSGIPRSGADTSPSGSSNASFVARHLAALAVAVLLLDLGVAYASRDFAWSIVPGWHYPILAPRAVPWFLGVTAILAIVHGLLAVALWQRLRQGKTHRAGT
jgi:hypothetical protein